MGVITRLAKLEGSGGRAHGRSMDSKLARYYRSALSKFVWLIALLGAAVNLLISWASERFGQDSVIADVAGSLLSFGVIASLFLFAEKKIRTRLWRLAYPEWDLSGKWSGETRYEKCFDLNISGPNDTFQPFERPNDVILEQDCLEITVVAAVSPTSRGSWYSLASEFEVLRTGPTVRYAYRVDYGGVPGFPHEAVGYEILNVVEPILGKRPLRLSGSFSHCMRGQGPVYSGSVAFSRVDEIPASRWKRFVIFLGTRIAKFGKPTVE